MHLGRWQNIPPKKIVHQIIFEKFASDDPGISDSNTCVYLKVQWHTWQYMGIFESTRAYLCPFTHCTPQTILGKQGALLNFLGEILGMSFWSSNSLLKLKNDALFTRLNHFGEFFMWFFLWFCKSALVKMLPQNIQFLKILKSLVFFYYFEQENRAWRK